MLAAIIRQYVLRYGGKPLVWQTCQLNKEKPYSDVLSAIGKEKNFSEKLYDVMRSYLNATIAGDDRETTWHTDLNEQANRIAHSLVAQCIRTNAVVEFTLSRISCLPTIIARILKVGVAYLSIKPTCPNDRINYIFEDRSAKMFITKDIIFVNYYQ